MKITKAIITAAGRGTRFLPASSAYQKEMVPVMHKPQIQWVIEEAIESGITDIAIVCREGVDTLQKYLEKDDKLWNFLKENNKEHFMDSWVRMEENANITLLEQKETNPYGNGTPFIIAKDFINGESFVAMWGDDIMVHVDKTKQTALKQMINYFEEYNPSAVMSAMKVLQSEISRYGCFEYHSEKEATVPFQIKRLIEKPEPKEAPSLMANACRFVLSPEVLVELEAGIQGKGGEIWLSDAIDRLIQRGRTVMAPTWSGSEWAPVGDPLRWLKANALVALNEKQYRDDVKKMLEEIVKT